MIRAILIFCLLPIPLVAQSLRETIDAGTHISLEEWQTMTRGKTVIYQRFGVELGREFYPISGDKVYYLHADGYCLEGVITYQSPSFCFDWEGRARMCFEQKRVGEEIYIISLQGGNFTLVGDIIDDPFQCQPEFLSSLTLPSLTGEKS